MDLENLSIKELQALRAKINSKIKLKRIKEKAERKAKDAYNKSMFSNNVYKGDLVEFTYNSKLYTGIVLKTTEKRVLIDSNSIERIDKTHNIKVGDEFTYWISYEKIESNFTMELTA